MCIRDRFYVQRLRSLDPEKLYTDTDTGEVYSGALLMNAGVNLTQAVFLDGQSVVKHFIAK